MKPARSPVRMFRPHRMRCPNPECAQRLSKARVFGTFDPEDGHGFTRCEFCGLHMLVWFKTLVVQLFGLTDEQFRWSQGKRLDAILVKIGWLDEDAA